MARNKIQFQKGLSEPAILILGHSLGSFDWPGVV